MRLLPAGGNLSTPPAEVTITFDDVLEPGSSFTVTGGSLVEVGTGEVDLTVADRNVLAGAVTITEPGIYTAMAVPGQGATLPFFGSLSVVAAAVIHLRRIMEAR